MATRIREFDWTGHPIGSPGTWPQSLRLALGICLNSAFPTAIYWGPDLRLLYNDAWSTIPGPRHPGCLGEPARAVWSDIWHVIEPQFIRVIESGEGLFVDDQLLPMRRFGLEEETYWSYSFTPIRGEDGSIEGIFNTGQEMTAKVLTRRETAFLLRLNEELRAGDDPEAMMALICRMLGTHLQAARVGIREVDPLSGDLIVRTEWTAEGVAPAGAVVPWDSLTSIALTLGEGRVVRIDCTESSKEPDVQALFRNGASSVLAIPSHRMRELHSVIFVHRSEARPWSNEEVATVEHAFSQAVQAVERERANARERAMMHEIDHRSRNMLAVSQALIRLVRADDVETFRASVLERISSLGKTLGLLSESKWAGAPLAELLRSELAPYLSETEPRVTLQGPQVVLDPTMAQPMAMAFHELVTNALKYGALSNAQGRLSVTWHVRDGSVLDIEWLEKSDRRAITGASQGSGFGTRLLHMTIESQLGGKVTHCLGEDGLHCTMEVSLSSAR